MLFIWEAVSRLHSFPRLNFVFHKSLFPRSSVTKLAIQRYHDSYSRNDHLFFFFLDIRQAEFNWNIIFCLICSCAS